MNLETFFGKFDLFADASDAVAKMRELILQLGVRGKLVQQDPKEGDADALLEAIASAHKKNGRYKTAEPAEAIELPEAERWHDVPASWRWVRLGVIGDIIGGGTPRSENSEYFTDEGIPWLTPADLNGFKEKRIFRGRRCITLLGLENSSAQLLPEGSVLFSSRAPIGYVAIAGTELATNQGFKSCVPFINETNEFLYYYLMSAAARIDSQASGTTFREVSGKIVNQIPVPLPPLAEQKRIVAKVDDLMALCDRLEAQQQKREARHAALARASLARFADAPTPANLNFIFHKSYNIAPTDLRKSILTLAVQGKLVPQDPNDEPVKSSLPKLAAVAVDPDGDLFPSHWLRVPLGEIGEWRGGGTPSKSRPDFWEGSLPWVSPKDMKVSRIADAQDHISEAAIEGSSVRLIPKGSLLMVVRGMILARAFPVALTTREVTINQDMKALLPLESEAAEFLLIALRAFEPDVLTTIERSSHGTCKLKTDVLEAFVIPIPPLTEQRRIVAKVNELMSLVEALETQLATARTAAEKLMEAVVAELTGKDTSRERESS
jgi:type I restriction enzyme, S subunit